MQALQQSQLRTGAAAEVLGLAVLSCVPWVAVERAEPGAQVVCQALVACQIQRFSGKGLAVLLPQQL
jgi:hypothetical protein